MNGWNGNAEDITAQRRAKGATKACARCGADISGRRGPVLHCQPCAADKMREVKNRQRARRYHARKAEKEPGHD